MKYLFLFFYSVVSFFPDSYYPIVGKISNRLRYFFFRKIHPSNKKFDDVIINKGSIFSLNKEIVINSKSSIGRDSRIQGPLTIGNEVMIGPELMTYTDNHIYVRTDVTIRSQGHSDQKPIIIEDDVWIGARVTILPGVTIRKGTVVAAGSVVTKTLEGNSVIGGVPAKLIKKRG